jgi:hypothetical protein
MATFSKLTVMLATVFIFQGNTSKAQGGDPPFVKGSNTIGFGLGFGDYYNYVGSGYTVLPAFTFIYDHGSFEKVGPGTIGIGGIISAKSRYYKFGKDDKYSDNSFIVGVRGSYHLTLLADKNNKFDPYGGIMFGLQFRTRKDSYLDYTRSNVNPVSALFVGAKYNFTKNFGAFAELGYDISILRLGINVNF